MNSLGPIILVLLSMIGFSPEDHQYVYNEATYDLLSSVEEESIKGMIVPHHTVPMDIIVDMYKRAPDVKHILLISPDHFLDEDRHVTTSKQDWSGGFGKILNNKDLTSSLLALDFVKENDREIFIEHGLNTHIPLIAKYFPEADLSNLMISKNTDYHELNELLDALPDDLFIIASVDFSHYLTYKEACENDEKTLEMMEKKNYDEFFVKSDAYFDSPMCLYVIFKYYEDFAMEVFENKNAADYLGSYYNTTSYFTIGFK
ncbi:AmmeMemoRadiSam system protein B [Acidaminobacter sp. JC074]|uniref:AmmeMemoRadiSam system protein B n=1 Tax=Acidaminobacter sp. JC074 TaxID=2530199 RepID=UPI001F0D6EEB|nr:AmmeMemoRadiSam system protein B [Acidaminobacter sp. JC074]MCH4890248.1 AmmeMemoRadiSam system protein B [Acidaminobacter sp. JC074]